MQALMPSQLQNTKPVNFSGRGAGPIKALHSAPGMLSQYEMAEHTARAIAPYGIDMVIHLIPPQKRTQGKEVPLHCILKVDPKTHQIKPEVMNSSQQVGNAPEREDLQQLAEKTIDSIRTGRLGDQPESFTSQWLQDHIQFGPTHLRTDITTGNPQKQAMYASIAKTYGKPLLPQEKFGPAAFGPAAFGPAAFGPAAFGPAAFGPAAFGMDYGNIFLDIKKPDGSRCHLVGESYLNDMKQSLKNNKIVEDKGIQLEYWAKHFLAKRLGVKAEEVIYLPEPNFHLDMMMTPLTYPDILVQDPQMCAQVLEATLADLKARPRLSESQQKERDELQELLYKTQQHEGYLTRNHYSPMAQVIETLKTHGFNPIPAPLVYGHLEVGPNPDKIESVRFFDTKESESDCVNLANAHVHQMPDGRLVMLTMSSSRPNLNRFAKEAILKSLPKGSELVMISGGKGPKGYDGDPPKTYFEHALNSKWGGLHCTFAEEMQPSFYADA